MSSPPTTDPPVPLKRPHSDSAEDSSPDPLRKSPFDPSGSSLPRASPCVVERVDDVTSLPTLNPEDNEFQPSSSPKAQTAAHEDHVFEHTPLDLSQETIRVIEVLPLDSNGVIRCRVRHTIINSRYTCVSYVWGPADDHRIIHLNGQAFRVRRNLWDFLHVASSQGAREGNLGIDNTSFSFEEATRSLWIDALCIDQENNDERNHQVQQMGMIFSSAQRVLAWMGRNLEFASLLHFMRVEMQSRRFFDPDYFLALDIFCKDHYWKRAWITQEVQLARQVLLLADTEAIDLDYLHEEIEDSIVRTFGSIIHKELWQKISDTIKQHETFTVLENLYRYRWKECSDRLDIVYSLVSISSDGQGLRVEYDINYVQLARNVLGLLGDDLCLGHARTVLHTLHNSSSPMVLANDLPTASQSFISIETQPLLGKCHCCASVISKPNIKSKDRLERLYIHCLGCIRSKTKKTNSYGETLETEPIPHLLLAQFEATSIAPETTNVFQWRLFWMDVTESLVELTSGPNIATLHAVSTSATVYISFAELCRLVDMVFVTVTGAPSHSWRQLHSSSTQRSGKAGRCGWKLTN